MAWANVQGTGTFNATSGTTLALAYGSNVVAGNRLVAVCVWIGTSITTTTCAVTDSQTNTWAGVAGSLATNSTVYRVQIFHTPAGSSAANTVTMTTSATTTERAIMLAEFSGLSGSLGASPLATSGVATANPSANITVGAATSLLVGGLVTGGTATQGTGWSLISAQDGNASEYRLPAGTGAQAVSFTQAAADYALGAVEFLATAGAAAAVRTRRTSIVPMVRAANY